MSRADTSKTTRGSVDETKHWTDLYSRIRYDSGLEARAFECLAEPDVDACRETFGDLVAALSVRDANGFDAAVVGLLHDVLQKVNRRVHRTPQDEASYQESRIALIEGFATAGNAREAQAAFMPALNRLLVTLKRADATPHLLVDRARRYIDQHYHERIFLSSVAVKMNVSSNYLSRVFRKEVGTTLTGYIQTKRLEHARLLLAEGQHSISEIAYLVGYQHYRDFYRNFVKREKASPREVQRRLTARWPRGGESGLPASESSVR